MNWVLISQLFMLITVGLWVITVVISLIVNHISSGIKQNDEKINIKGLIIEALIQSMVVSVILCFGLYSLGGIGR